MAQIKAFRGIRPRADIVDRVAALPYDVYNRQEAKEEVKREPLSFLKIDRAETQFGDDTDIYAPEVYQKAHDLLWEMVEDGSLIKEEEPSFYLYELTMNGRSQTGLVACAAVDDYINGIIMKHENTREDKELDRIRHVNICDAQTGPIFLAYRHNDVIRKCMEETKAQMPIFDFTASDGIIHRGWKISDTSVIRTIEETFNGISKIYIADGHHRAASAVKVSLKRREEAKAKGESADTVHEYDYFLSVLFAEDELYIMDYNRVVADLNGYTQEEFVQRIAEVCDVQENMVMEHRCEGGVCGMQYVNVPCRPTKKGEIGMYLGGIWYQLTIKKEFESEDPVKGLDVSVLQERILAPVLGIQNPKTDERIRFVGGIRGLKELEHMADECAGVAFSMYPTSMQELFAVADAGLLMPPKSTWFEPKLRSGLFIHALG